MTYYDVESVEKKKEKVKDWILKFRMIEEKT